MKSSWYLKIKQVQKKTGSFKFEFSRKIFHYHRKTSTLLFANKYLYLVGLYLTNIIIILVSN